MIFEIEKNPYDFEKVNLFSKDKLELQPNSITCFVGCNGSGKTSLIDNIIGDIIREEKARDIERFKNVFYSLTPKEKEKTKVGYIRFNKHTDISYNTPNFFLEKGLQTMVRSTGEGLTHLFGDSSLYIKEFLPKMKDKTLFIFFDDCDAGTSIDMIADIKAVLGYIANDCKRFNVTYYIILTANSYEMCKDFDCVSVHDFKHKTFKTYEAYKKFVLNSREIKDKRYSE